MTLLALAIAVLLNQDPSPHSGDAASPPAQTHTQALPTAVAAPDLAALQLQVMLDRAGFSPGIIDGRMGPNTERALALYQQHRGDAAAEGVTPLATYPITEMDIAGPFNPDIPSNLAAQASLPALGYRSVVEALAERFHATPELLQQLNPNASFVAGEIIQVPNVEPLVVPAETLHIGPEEGSGEIDEASARPTGTAGRAETTRTPTNPDPPDIVLGRPDVIVTVAERDARLTVTGATGEVIFSAPVTTGSERDPLPRGEWKVTGIQFNPIFHYNPALFWDADPRHAKARIQPGPNNPVGLVWIDLDKAHYGIHGTPEPAAIGRAQSHGCVRLSNWDAVRLAGLVKPGTRVMFE